MRPEMEQIHRSGVHMSGEPVGSWEACLFTDAGQETWGLRHRKKGPICGMVEQIPVHQAEYHGPPILFP